ncbi:DUF3899 domain-containing protein [Metabacillus idriensis]|uniref:DUF3899 domain-containing protein n=1 Tax=Metabacillus idriensis TaxID=324768 RepID=A0A6I2M794_9BACI|nr:DUF3899 domain-containing protein [Metabacillus idriensis]MCM3595236.1 DUF3899 domain-containing protein [Metabacillus idriensis]MRX52736.1 DUF3899 domain-containing protein [Metabacillus idriensis]OHR72542.1 hypothetical protein HMPREF3291_21725 [Bacillus sp. HMSC76G11]
MKRKLFLSTFSVSFVLVFMLSLLFYGEITLLHYINISFYISGILLFISLFLLVAEGGFFDGITQGFRRTFQSKGSNLEKEEVEEMRLFSELLSIEYMPFLLAGLLLAATMLAGLMLYYL